MLLTTIQCESNKIIVIRDSYPTLYIPEAFVPLIKNIFGEECNIQIHTLGKLIHENQDISVPIPKEGTKQQRMDLLTRKLTKKWQHKLYVLLPHQQFFLSRYIPWHQDKKETSCLLYYSVGSCKSATAISVFSTIHVNVVYVIAGNSLIRQWVDELSHVPQFQQSKTTFIFLGFQEFVNQLIDNEDLLLHHYVIFDETHLLFKRTDRMKFQIECLLKAKHLFLLTATPILRINDVIALCQLLRVDVSQINTELTLHEAENLLKQIDPEKAMIHYYNPLLDKKACKKYAPFTVIKKKIPMTWAQTLEYLVRKKSQFQLESFTLCSSSRNAYHTQQKKLSNLSSSGDCPKLKACAEQVITFNQFPQLVMVFYLEDGKRIHDYLHEMNPTIKIEYETGSTTNEERELYRKKINKKKIQILILSAVGSYGLNFLGVEAIHLFSYENNEYKTQAQGRGLRYNAHKVDRKTGEIPPVVIFHYLSIFPPKESIPKDLSIQFYSTYVKRSNKSGINTKIIKSIPTTRKRTQSETTESVEQITKEIQEWMPFDFNTALISKLETEENYKTIDELLEVTNHEKEVENQFLLHVLQSSSI